MTAITYIVRNADGLAVAEYADPEHAIESARENAATGSAANLDVYYVDAQNEWGRSVESEFNVEFYAS